MRVAPQTQQAADLRVGGFFVVSGRLEDGDNYYSPLKILKAEQNSGSPAPKPTTCAQQASDFHNPNDDGFSIATASEETRDTLDNPANFAALMAASGYSVTSDRDR